MNKIKAVLLAVLFFITINLVNAQSDETDYKVYNYSTSIENGQELEKNILLKNENNIIAQVTMRNGKSLGMHSEAGAFWVFATGGSGKLIFENDRIVKLAPGKLITVKPGVPHDVIADPEVSIMIIKFINEEDEAKNDNHEH